MSDSSAILLPGPCSVPVTSRLAASFLPSTAVLEMTYRCNHACTFCSCPWYAPGGAFDVRPELTAAEWIALVRRLTALGVCNIAFTGGEPLMKEGLAGIIEAAAACTTEFVESRDGALAARQGPPQLFLLSNGRIMRPAILDLCRRHRINLSMSLPGLATFEEHTAGGDPQNVLCWFREARAAGVTTTAGVTVTRRNLHELYETLAEALLAGADTILLNRFLPGGRGLEHPDLMLDRADIPVMLDTAEDVLRTANRFGSVGTELPKCFIDSSRYRHLSVGTRCSAALDFFVVDPSGYVRVCNHSPVRLRHVSELDRLPADPYWRRYVQKDYLPPACASCRMSSACDGGCREAAHVVGGRLDALDPMMASPE